MGLNVRERAEHALGQGHWDGRRPAGFAQAVATGRVGTRIGYALLDVADAIREVAAEQRRANDVAEAREKRLAAKRGKG
jgi:hypothetical protein